jgi:sulfonate transport system substrate-binding protein
VIAGLAQEAAWTDEHPVESELMLQKAARYDDAIREQFVRLHRRYKFYPPSDAQFVQQLQTAADWLTKRKVLPEPITVSDYLATL